MVCDYTYLSHKAVVVGFFWACIVYLVIPFLCCYIFYYTGQVPAHKCNGSEYAVVWCFMVGLPSLGPTFYVLSALPAAMACIAALNASATDCTIPSLAFVCSVTIFTHLFVCLCNLCFWVSLDETALFYQPVLLRLPIFVCFVCTAYICLFMTFLLLTWCSVSCFIKDNTGLCLYAYLLLCVYNRMYLTICACAYIYRGSAL